MSVCTGVGFRENFVDVHRRLFCCLLQAPITPEDIENAAECFGVGGGALEPITSFNGRPIGSGEVRRPSIRLLLWSPVSVSVRGLIVASNAARH